jgi:HK97 family phage portal protein
MKIRFPFFKKSIRDIDISSEDSVNTLLGISNQVPTQVSPRLAYYLSERNADLGGSVEKISKNIAGLKKGLRDEEGDITFEHDILTLLNNPGFGVSGSQFWREITESYLLTQEAWIVARGNITSPPLALVFIRPYEINIIMNETDGLPNVITTESNKDRRTYFRFESGADIRFIDKTGLNEIFPIIGALSLIDNWRGRSPLIKLFYDLKMNTGGKRHNVSLLDNGMRTTAILSPKPSSKEGLTQRWSKKSVDEIQDYTRSFNQGAGNAGNVLILGTPADVQGLSQSNKDMDFLALLQNSQVAIYNLYNIPLPLVLPQTMTLDNYTAANRIYYTKAVFPVYDDLTSGIMNTLGKRYKIPPDSEFSFLEVAIRDLQNVLVENMKNLKETENVSMNEIRKVGGLSDIPGGEVILVSSNKIPFAMVSEPLEFPEETEAQTEELEQAEE